MKQNMQRRLGRAVAVGTASLAVHVAACSTPVPVGTLRGTRLAEPLEKIDFTLHATDGEPYAFRRETSGYLTLLFFGYTNCPDVCPVHMANLGAVLDKLSPQVANQIKVVMVTTDPARDSPARLGAWLDQFHRSFVGLIGSQDSVNAIMHALGLPPAVRLETGGDGEPYVVGHASQVIAFTRDDLAHVVYPFGTRQADWAHDLPLLLQAAVP